LDEFSSVLSWAPHPPPANEYACTAAIQAWTNVAVKHEDAHAKVWHDAANDVNKKLQDEAVEYCTKSSAKPQSVKYQLEYEAEIKAKNFFEAAEGPSIEKGTEGRR
jgi:hypothetical protein